MFLIVGLEATFNIEFIAMCMLYLRTKFHMPNSGDSLVVAVKPKVNTYFM
jgi:hypothetical protein